MRLRLPWGEELTIEHDVEQFTLELMNMTAEYYVDRPDPTLIVVNSSNFVLEDDVIVVISCKVVLTDAWKDGDDDERVEEIWQDFMLLEDNPAPDQREQDD